MSAFLFDRLHNGLGRVLDLRQAQHGITASNIAHASTPGYRARYIPFDQILARAVGKGSQLELSRTDRRHVLSPGADPENPEVVEIDPPPWAADQNSVDPEREAVRMTENSLMYDAVSTGLSRRIAMLRYAASDGRQA
jgi:flagellar basal-body rod protein FlgB